MYDINELLKDQPVGTLMVSDNADIGVYRKTSDFIWKDIMGYSRRGVFIAEGLIRLGGAWCLL